MRRSKKRKCCSVSRTCISHTRRKKRRELRKAREKGLEPLAAVFREQKEESGTPQEFAQPFISEEKGVATADEAIKGACDIIAEMISDDPELTAAIREKTHDSGVIVTEAADPEEKTVYEMYYEYSEGAGKDP